MVFDKKNSFWVIDLCFHIPKKKKKKRRKPTMEKSKRMKKHFFFIGKLQTLNGF